MDNTYKIKAIEALNEMLAYSMQQEQIYYQKGKYCDAQDTKKETEHFRDVLLTVMRDESVINENTYNYYKQALDTMHKRKY